jgi:hypothetical protein
MRIKCAKSNDSGSKGRERSRQQEDLAAALKLTDDNNAFTKIEGGRSDFESDDGSEYSDGNGTDEKPAERFRLLGFGERGLNCPDDGNWKTSNREIKRIALRTLTLFKTMARLLKAAANVVMKGMRKRGTQERRYT